MIRQLNQPTSCGTCNKVRQLINPIVKAVGFKPLPVATTLTNPAWPARK